MLLILQGFTGQKGESGEPGLHGLTGAKGEVGDPGVPGPIVSIRSPAVFYSWFLQACSSLTKILHYIV